MIDRTQMKILGLLYGCWIVLLLEHICWKLEFALEISVGVGIITLLYTIQLLLKYIITTARRK